MLGRYPLSSRTAAQPRPKAWLLLLCKTLVEERKSAPLLPGSQERPRFRNWQNDTFLSPQIVCEKFGGLRTRTGNQNSKKCIKWEEERIKFPKISESEPKQWDGSARHGMAWHSMRAIPFPSSLGKNILVGVAWAVLVLVLQGPLIAVAPVAPCKPALPCLLLTCLASSAYLIRIIIWLSAPRKTQEG